MQMKKNIRILGSGLICVDVVRNGSKIKIMNGGSCANVISVLSQIGYDCSIIREKYSDSFELFLSKTLTSLGVKELFYKKTKSITPRIIEEVRPYQHCFYTICPNCGQKTLNLKLPKENDIVILEKCIKDFNVFYSDRTSSGIRMLMKKINDKSGIVVFEPNSFRNVTGLFETAAYADIIKFSKERIPFAIAEKLRVGNNQVKLLISTDGAQGLSFSYRTTGGKMSSWLTIPSAFQGPIIDTSGAGDWLTAGFLSELLKDKDSLSLKILLNETVIRKMLIKGMEYSKLCCAAIGAQGVFYSPKYSSEFNKLFVSHNINRRHWLQSENIKNVDVCPYCYSHLPKRA